MVLPQRLVAARLTQAQVHSATGWLGGKRSGFVPHQVRHQVPRAPQGRIVGPDLGSLSGALQLGSGLGPWPIVLSGHSRGTANNTCTMMKFIRFSALFLPDAIPT